MPREYIVFDSVSPGEPFWIDFQGVLTRFVRTGVHSARQADGPCFACFEGGELVTVELGVA